MKYILLNVFIASVILTENSIGKPSKPRQLTGISFAIPALNILGGGNPGGNQGGGGNLFRQATITRTIVRTVSTVTQGVVRTCTGVLPAAGAAFPPCPGRRRRNAEDNELDHQSGRNIEDIVPTEPSMIVIIGTTTVTNQEAVSEILNLAPTLNSTGLDEQASTIRNLLGDEDLTTLLYPSQDAPLALRDEIQTTEHGMNVQTEELDSTTVENIDKESSNDDISRAGFNFAGTTTITSTIPVTAVTTSYISGGVMSTLTVLYTGCSPVSFPVTGTPC